MARRPGVGGAWLTRDLELREVERTRTLSGPSTITATLDGSVARRIMPDGRPLIEDWGTHIYAISENTNRIVNNGIVRPGTAYENDTRITCAGYSSYPTGLIYLNAKLWGPVMQVGAQPAVYEEDGVTLVHPAVEAVSGLPRPDSIMLYEELWDYVQSRTAAVTYSDLGVEVYRPPESPGRPIGTYEEPYRLQYWDSPDIGAEMERLAQYTPFDFEEVPLWVDPGPLPAGAPFPYQKRGRKDPEPMWPAGYGSTQHDVHHAIRVGYPRLGRQRTDLRFAIGENIVLPPPVTSSETANMVLGIGNGDPGPSMAQAMSSIEDGRLKRIAVVTDKTLSQANISTLTSQVLWRMQQRPQITTVAVADHRNARLTSINLGDDILVQGQHPQYGKVNDWVRVLGITEGSSESAAVLSVLESAQFTYQGEDA